MKKVNKLKEKDNKQEEKLIVYIKIIKLIQINLHLVYKIHMQNNIIHQFHKNKKIHLNIV